MRLGGVLVGERDRETARGLFHHVAGEGAHALIERAVDARRARRDHLHAVLRRVHEAQNLAGLFRAGDVAVGGDEKFFFLFERRGVRHALIDRLGAHEDDTPDARSMARHGSPAKSVTARVLLADDAKILRDDDDAVGRAP